MHSKITEDHIDSLQLSERKKLGQYMTPASIADRMAEILLADKTNIKDKMVLDPAVGTGELLRAVERQKSGMRLSGFDMDAEMLKVATKNIGDLVPEKKLYTDNINLFSYDWLKYENTIDYIIANPPYFEINKNDSQLAYISNFSSIHEKGRLNIYALFFEYALKLLKNGGEMVFLVPPSMNNGAYFIEMRKNILHNGYIKNIEIIRNNNSFTDALTSVQIIHIIKNNNKFDDNYELSKNYVYGDKNNFIFTENKKTIDDYWIGKKSLYDYGFTVKTGQIVWNNHKTDFISVTHPNNPLPLYYSKDITANNQLVLSDKIPADRRYLPQSLNKYHNNNSIIVNRIVGSLENPKLKIALISTDKYYTENHVNIITHNNEGMLNILYNYLNNINNNELGKYLQCITGNTQLSTKELLYKIPVMLEH